MENFINILSGEGDKVILPPGAVYFGGNHRKIQTILGSCVAITVWHEKHKVGGMCHYLIAEQNEKIKLKSSNYRYGINCLNYLLSEMKLYPPINEFTLGLFGGSNMYESNIQPSIGETNVAYARAWAASLKLTFTEEDVLDIVGRTLLLDLSTGKISLKKYQ